MDHLIGRFRWIEDEEAWMGIRPAWQRLLDSDPRHSAFLSWEWLSVWWRHFGAERRLRILVGEDAAGTVRAILPLQVARPRRLGLASPAVWQLLGADSVACSDHLGLIAEPGLSVAARHAMALELGRALPPSAALCLSDLAPDDPLLTALRTWASARERPYTDMAGPICPVLTLPESWEALLADLSANFRSQVRSSLRRASEKQGWALHSIEDGDEVREAMQLLVRLNRQRLRSKGIRSSLEQPAMAAFLKEVAPVLVESGRAWLDALTWRGRGVALALHLVQGDTVSYYQGGFDVELSEYRPATVLFAAVMQRAIAQGYRRFDFLRGAEAYKYRWGAQAQPSAGLCMPPVAWLSRRLYALEHLRPQAWLRQLWRHSWRGAAVALAVVGSVYDGA
ncbi:MAG TPA: GNAT family N-acetyltransferase [Candidatus Competibacteraceae bacterium]|nr:GNAT family N-acetyltransferase [Candidatus Competibacteraceae bacterium]